MFKQIYYDDDKKCCVVEDDDFFIESRLELIDWSDESNFREHEFIQGINFEIDNVGIVWFTWNLRAAGLDTFNFVKWTPTTAPVTGYGTWDDTIYGWDI